MKDLVYFWSFEREWSKPSLVGIREDLANVSIDGSSGWLRRFSTERTDDCLQGVFSVFLLWLHFSLGLRGFWRHDGRW